MISCQGQRAKDRVPNCSSRGASLIPVLYSCVSSLIRAPPPPAPPPPCLCASMEGESKQGFEVRSLVQLSAELLLAGWKMQRGTARTCCSSLLSAGDSFFHFLFFYSFCQRCLNKWLVFFFVAPSSLAEPKPASARIKKEKGWERGKRAALSSRLSCRASDCLHDSTNCSAGNLWLSSHRETGSRTAGVTVLHQKMNCNKILTVSEILPWFVSTVSQCDGFTINYCSPTERHTKDDEMINKIDR